MAISRILSGLFLNRDDHSSHPSRIRGAKCPMKHRRSETAATASWCDGTRELNRAGCPSSVLSCTAWGFSCLADHSASGELLPRLFTLTCAFLKEPAVCFL